MSCDHTFNRFVITKNFDNTYTFTIKQNNSTLPMTIEDTDTFKAFLIYLKDGKEYNFGTSTFKPLVVKDKTNGKVELTIDKSETLNLVSSKGAEVDRYYLRPTYKLIIECDTKNNGSFLAKMHYVYVD